MKTKCSVCGRETDCYKAHIDKDYYEWWCDECCDDHDRYMGRTLPSRTEPTMRSLGDLGKW